MSFTNAAYLDAKSSEGDLLEESLEEDDEGTDGQQTQRSDDEVFTTPLLFSSSCNPHYC